MNNRKISLKAAILTAALLGGAPAIAIATLPASSSQESDAVNTMAIFDNETILNIIHHVNSAEISECTEVLSRLENPKVREFTQTLINDHLTNEEKVLKLANTKGWQVFAFQPSTVESTIDSKLKTLSGSNLDTAFLKVQLLTHEKVLQMLTFLQTGGVDSDLKSLINETIPVIQSHIDLANMLIKIVN